MLKASFSRRLAIQKRWCLSCIELHLHATYAVIKYEVSIFPYDVSSIILLGSMSGAGSIWQAGKKTLPWREESQGFFVQEVEP